MRACGTASSRSERQCRQAKSTPTPAPQPAGLVRDPLRGRWRKPLGASQMMKKSKYHSVGAIGFQETTKTFGFAAGGIAMNSKPPASTSPLVGDSHKGIAMLYGILLVLTVYGIAETAKMLYAGTRANLIELIIFAWLALDAVVLLITTLERKGEKPGLMRYLDVWILGLIPYFVWAIIYWVGNKVVNSIQRSRVNILFIALFLFLGIIIMCACVYLITTGVPFGTSLSTWQ
jgi:hypothetical protein